MMKEISHKSPNFTKIPIYHISSFQKLQKSLSLFFNILHHFSTLNYPFLFYDNFHHNFQNSRKLLKNPAELLKNSTPTNHKFPTILIFQQISYQNISIHIKTMKVILLNKLNKTTSIYYISFSIPLISSISLQYKTLNSGLFPLSYTVLQLPYPSYIPTI